jgi:hypothetical protein
MTDDERLAYVIDLVRHRCPELGRDDLALLAPPEDTEEMIPGRIVMQVMEVIDRMTERQDRFEAQLAAAEPIPIPARLH